MVSTTAKTNCVLKKIKHLLFGLSLLGAFTVSAQDIHFTQYNNSPLTLNPANTGAFFGDWRLVNNYRSQWGGVLDKPITSIALGYDRPFFLENEDRIGVGLYVVNDNASELGPMTNRVGLSFSYLKLIGNQELRVGVQFAYTIRSIDNNLSFPEGFNPATGEFDPNLTVLEPLDKYSSGYADVNLGAVYSLDFKTFRPTVGLAAFHLNGPKENFFANESKIATKTVAHASFLFYPQDRIFVDPHFLITSQAKASNFIIGAKGGYELKPNKLNVQSFYLGAAVRNGFSENPDSFILQAGSSFSNIKVGLSYDFNISELKGTQTNGSLEFSLIYTAPSTRLIKSKIESERL